MLNPRVMRSLSLVQVFSEHLAFEPLSLFPPLLKGERVRCSVHVMCETSRKQRKNTSLDNVFEVLQIFWSLRLFQVPVPEFCRLLHRATPSRALNHAENKKTPCKKILCK